MATIREDLRGEMHTLFEKFLGASSLNVASAKGKGVLGEPPGFPLKESVATFLGLATTQLPRSGFAFERSSRIECPLFNGSDFLGWW